MTRTAGNLYDLDTVARELDATARDLAEEGVELLVGTALDFAGVTRSKAVPMRRLRSFATSGMGASPSWVVFCADNGIAFTSGIGVSGDLRLRLDPSRLRAIGDGMHLLDPGQTLRIPRLS